MTRQKSVGKNVSLNLLKTMVNVVFPLITFPYASRVLQVRCMGRYSFSLSVVSYFSLIAALGIQTYAIREGSKYRDDKEKINRFFSEIFSIHLISTTFAYFLLFISVLTVDKLRGYKIEIAILSAEIILLTLSLNWVYIIYEDFVYITIVSFILQTVSLIGLILFVHSPSDLYIYTFLSMFAGFGYGIFSFIHARKYVHLLFKPTIETKHLKPIFTLFIATIAITIYVSSDATILGWLKDDYAVGIYSTASRIYLAVKQLLNAIIAVMLPRISYYIGMERFDDAKKMGDSVVDGMVTLCFPCMTGLMCMSREIIIVYVGKNYQEAYMPLALLGVALVFAVFANFYCNCLLVSFCREMIVMIATIFSAVLNILLNFVLIPHYSTNAAAVTTILAEASIFIISWYKSRENLEVGIQKKVLFPVLIGCLGIVVICIASKIMIGNTVVRLLLAVIVSVLFYLIIQYVTGNIFVKNMASQFIKGKKQIGE